MRPWLFVDIDGTLTRPRPGVVLQRRPAICEQPMLWEIKRLAVQWRGLDAAEADAIIAAVNATVWWDWSDYLDALGLDRAAFWRWADENERRYIEPVAADLADHFARLRRAHRLAITSNNPTAGILHKLRIAGLADRCGAAGFEALLGTNEMRATKSSADFWRRAARRAGPQGHF
jgi:FMN phosphatase YigB (HAD superfamily)